MMVTHSFIPQFLGQTVRLEEYDLGFFVEAQKFTAYIKQNLVYLLPHEVPLEEACDAAKYKQPNFLFARLELRYANESKVALTTVTGVTKKYTCDTPTHAKELAQYFAEYARLLKRAGAAAEEAAVAATVAAAERAKVRNRCVRLFVF